MYKIKLVFFNLSAKVVLFFELCKSEEIIQQKVSRVTRYVLDI